MPPRQARWRAFADKALAIVAYLAVMGILVLLGRAGLLPEGAFIAISLLPTALVLMTPGLDAQMGNAEITRTRLTVYTMTGRRSLDLTALRRVRRFTMLTKSATGDFDLLVVTDARGVRAGLASADANEAIARSVTARTRVSRRARRRLARRPFTMRAAVLDVLTGLLSVVFFAALLLVLPAIGAGLAYGW